MLLALNCEAGEVDGTTMVKLKADGALAERYLGGAEAAVYLIRPDQHVAARWTAFDAEAVTAALATAKGH